MRPRSLQLIAFSLALIMVLSLFVVTKGNLTVAYLIGIPLAILEYLIRQKKKKARKDEANSFEEVRNL